MIVGMFNRWRKKSIGNELNIIFITFLTLVIALFSLAAYFISSHIFYQQASSYNNQVLRLFSDKIDSTIAQVNKLSFFVYQNDTIHQIASSENNILQKVHLSSVLEQQFINWQSFSNYDIHVQQAYFIHDDNIWMSIPWNALEQKPYQNTDWYQKAKNARGRILYCSPESIPELPAVSSANEASFRFVALRLVYDIYSNQYDGVLLLDVVIKDIDSIIENTDLNQKTQIYIMSEAGDCLFSINAQENLSLLMDNKTLSSNSRVKGEHSTYLLSRFSSEETQWEYVILTDYQKLMSPIQQMIFLAVIAGTLLLSIAFLLNRLVIRKVIHGLHDLQISCQNAVDNNFQEKIEIREENEIRDLKCSFNLMMDKINHLMNYVYLQQIRENEAKLNALQSQINPHFLYNTLSTISAMAAIRDVPEICSMANALTDFFRYTIQQKDRFVTLKQECENLNNYIQIQSVRYGQRLRFHLNISPELLSCRVLCFILQPLVENAIIHGIDPKIEGGSILVSAYVKQDTLTIQVSDNGIGMTGEKLNEIQRIITDSATDITRKSIGLRNVVERLKLVYKTKVQIWADSKEDCGTIFQITIPYEKASIEPAPPH